MSRQTLAEQQQTIILKITRKINYVIHFFRKPRIHTPHTHLCTFVHTYTKIYFNMRLLFLHAHRGPRKELITD